ncbi:polycomb complex protein BMI-1-like isoform X1 [Mytilus trossulus]|uniref:polycomb complex protein BMI-1-like isoform X1 n=2 Tax=Mytilus trossulus TaxID=6551 RepID=UPI003003E282
MLKMHRTLKIKITELNPQLICVLCGGYLVDASTIVECLHSFCKTCIARYLDNSKCCPICDTMVHKTKPMQNVRLDKTLQDLVYKLVPGLYKNEMKRRRDFYAAYPIDQDRPPGPSEDRGNEDHDRLIYTEDEKISLELELFAGFNPSEHLETTVDSDPDKLKEKDIRYLLCPAGVCVGHLKKFVRLKFDIPKKYKIDVYHSDEPLKDDLTLMDIAYIYTWRRNSPLKLIYSIYEVMGTKRTAAFEETATEVTKYPRLSSDTEETDAYSESESQDSLSQDETTKKDTNENHIFHNEKNNLTTGVNRMENGNQCKINGFYLDSDLPVDLSNHKPKKITCDNEVSTDNKKDANGFIGHHFLQKPYTVNRNSPNDFSFKPKKKRKNMDDCIKEKGVHSNKKTFTKSEYDFNE